MIDVSVGIILEKKIGDYVEKGEVLAYIYANQEIIGKQEQTHLAQLYQIENTKVQKKNILEVLE